MATTPPDVLQQARQGDPSAIAALINRHLEPKGISAQVTQQGSALQVVLESDQVPNQGDLVAYVNKGISGLGLSSVQLLSISGKQSGSGNWAWTEDIPLNSDVQPTAAVLTPGNADLEEAGLDGLDLDLGLGPGTADELDLDALDEFSLDLGDTSGTESFDLDLGDASGTESFDLDLGDASGTESFDLDLRDDGELDLDLGESTTDTNLDFGLDSPETSGLDTLDFDLAEAADDPLGFDLSDSADLGTMDFNGEASSLDFDLGQELDQDLNALNAPSDDLDLDFGETEPEAIAPDLGPDIDADSPSDQVDLDLSEAEESLDFDLDAATDDLGAGTNSLDLDLDFDGSSLGASDSADALQVEEPSEASDDLDFELDDFSPEPDASLDLDLGETPEASNDFDFELDDFSPEPTNEPLDLAETLEASDDLDFELDDFSPEPADAPLDFGEAPDDSGWDEESIEPQGADQTDLDVISLGGAVDPAFQTSDEASALEPNLSSDDDEIWGTEAAAAAIQDVSGEAEDSDVLSLAENDDLSATSADLDIDLSVFESAPSDMSGFEGGDVEGGDVEAFTIGHEVLELEEDEDADLASLSGELDMDELDMGELDNVESPPAISGDVDEDSANTTMPFVGEDASEIEATDISDSQGAAPWLADLDADLESPAVMGDTFEPDLALGDEEEFDSNPSVEFDPNLILDVEDDLEDAAVLAPEPDADLAAEPDSAMAADPDIFEAASEYQDDPNAHANTFDGIDTLELEGESMATWGAMGGAAARSPESLPDSLDEVDEFGDTAPWSGSEVTPEPFGNEQFDDDLGLDDDATVGQFDPEAFDSVAFEEGRFDPGGFQDPDFDTPAGDTFEDNSFDDSRFDSVGSLDSVEANGFLPENQSAAMAEDHPDAADDFINEFGPDPSTHVMLPPDQDPGTSNRQGPALWMKLLLGLGVGAIALILLGILLNSLLGRVRQPDPVTGPAIEAPDTAAPPPAAEPGEPAPPAAEEPGAVDDANAFREAVNAAQNAANLAQNANTPADWQVVADSWARAIELMEQVPETDPNYEVAQDRAVAYQPNLAYARQNAQQ
jgi:pilus assembly protein FimV